MKCSTVFGPLQPTLLLGNRPLSLRLIVELLQTLIHPEIHVLTAVLYGA
jgi:hypothetical protein